MHATVASYYPTMNINDINYVLPSKLLSCTKNITNIIDQLDKQT